MPSGGRIAICGKFIKADDSRPYTERVQIIHFMVEKISRKLQLAQINSLHISQQFSTFFGQDVRNQLLFTKPCAQRKKNKIKIIYHAQVLCNVSGHHVADPRTNDWILVGGPLPLLMILIMYNYFCRSAGPRWMKDRKPFDLKYVLIVYNAVQVVFSAWLVNEVRLCRLASLPPK